ncbi:unnamed protein product [Parnassius mnemosyne]|uniref:DUF4817 domain-containing protein n=3 Tax=Parnassius mnemosyne TaxID=213953 RepID=A0AAV1L9N3_9NEOP
MERFSKDQRVIIVKTHYKNGESYAETARKLRQIFSRESAPNVSTIQRVVKKFEETGSIMDNKNPLRQRTGRSLENIAAVNESVAENPKTSIRHRSQQLQISRSTTQRILTKDLHLHAYKIQLTQELKPADHGKRWQFVQWVMEQSEVDTNFSEKVIFSDEAHFHLDGFVNTQNCRIWDSENPHAIHEKQMHPQRVTVWCGFWSGGVIGPYFFENEAEIAVTVNGIRYRNMITDFLWPQLDGMDLDNMWFQQDGATCHTAHETIDLLQQRFPEHIISRNSDVNWPPRSCDLTPCDFFLWGFVKSRVYANKPETIPELKSEIQRVIGEIQPHLCAKVMENFMKRVMACHRSRGGHLPDILFHT